MEINDKLLPTSINTLYDVEKFATYLAEVERCLFHPDEDFSTYVNYVTTEPCYTKEQADKRNELMQQCFNVCDKLEVDIYSFMNDECILTFINNKNLLV